MIAYSEKTATFLKTVCEEYPKNNYIDPKNYENYSVKRGLRNSNSTGVLAGVTRVGTAFGSYMLDGDRMPMDGKLMYRGIDILDIVNGVLDEERFGFEESVYLLLFGHLPNKEQLEEFETVLTELRNLPEHYVDDMILKAPSPDIMNKLSRGILALYSYDDNPDDTSLTNMLRQSMEIIARVPIIVANAFAVKRHKYDNESLVLHHPQEGLSLAENFLRTLRRNGEYTLAEARLLDICMILHAEHGGGNNSTFACRVLSSSGTDTYAAVSAAVGSLKGPKHGGANIKVMEMFEEIASNVKDWKDEDEISDYLAKIIQKKAGDGSGLIYGMGHAVYTQSDPRCNILKQYAKDLAPKHGMLDQFELLETVEKLTPSVFAKFKNDTKTIASNVDMYSGLVYKMLDIPPELYTPIFAIARVSGWCAHRIEETIYGGRIIRPAYKAVLQNVKYTALQDR